MAKKLLHAQFLIALAFIVFISAGSVDAFQGVPPTTAEKIKRTLISSLESAEHQKADTIRQIEENAKALLANHAELDTLLETTDKIGMSDETYTEVISILQGSRVELLIDLAGLEARQKAIDALSKKSDSGNSNATEMLDQLQQMYQLQQQNLQELEQLVKTGATSKRGIRDAELKMIELRIRMIQEKQQINRNPQMFEQLAQISIDQAEKKARLEQVEQMLAEFIETRDTLTMKRKLQQKINVIKGNNDVAKAKLENLERQIKNYEKQLTKFENDN